MTCEEFEELSGSYALDALNPDEQQEADAHLAHCSRCNQLVRELRATVALLPLSAPQVTPREELKDKIIAAIQKDASQSTPIVPTPIRPRNRQQSRRWIPQLVAIAAILILGLFGTLTAWNVSLNAQASTLQQKLDMATQKIDTLQNQLGQSQTPVSGVTAYTVQGNTLAQQAHGNMFYFSRQNITVMVVHGLPDLQGSHVYQGWLLQLHGETPVAIKSVGLLNVQNGTASISFPGNIAGYNTAAISVEPGPLATPLAPKGKVVATGTLT